jgi:transcription initiation factor TFIID TATA-box-binding protein
MDDFDDPLAALLAHHETEVFDTGAASSSAAVTKKQEVGTRTNHPWNTQIQKIEIKPEAERALALIPQGTELDADGSAIVPIEEVEIPDDVWPKIDNVIASINLKTTVDLKTIAFKARNAEYNPRKVNAVVMRLRDPRSTALVYAGGKIRLTGSKNEVDAKLACKKICRLMQRIGFPDAKFSQYKIESLVGSADCRFPIRLESMALEYPNISSYEPELFPGLVFRMQQPKVSILIFVSGKVVITGAKSAQVVNQAFSTLFPILWKFHQ